MNLESLLTNFLTSGLGAGDPETMRRIKTLNLVELVFVVLAPFLGLFYFYIGAFFLLYTSVVAGLLGIGVIFLLRFTKRPLLAANVALFILWAFLMVLRWKGGGVSAGGCLLLSWIWNGVFIVLAIFLAGYMWGTIWACLVFAESGLAMFLYRSGHHFPSLIPPEISPAYALAFYLLGLLTILLVGFLFQSERDDAYKREERKAEILRDSRRYLDHILERLPVPIFVLDHSHRVIEWNRACQDISGIPAREILGKRVWKGFFMDNEGSLADKMLDDPEGFSGGDSATSMTESGRFSSEGFLPYLKGGTRVIMSTAPIRDQEGKVRGVVQAIQDMGEEGQSASGDPSHPFVSLEEAGLPVFKVDAQGKVAVWNRACEERFGIPSSKMIGHGPLPIVSKQYRRDFRDTVMRVFKGESVRGKEWKFIAGGGKGVYVSAHAYPEKDSSGKMLGCVVITTDITDLKMRLKHSDRSAAESKEDLKKLKEEYDLLKSNIASFIRRKEE